MPPGPMDTFLAPPPNHPTPAEENAQLTALDASPESTIEDYNKLLLSMPKKVIQLYRAAETQKCVDLLGFIYQDIIHGSMLSRFQKLSVEHFILSAQTLDKIARILIEEQKPELYASQAQELLQAAMQFFEVVDKEKPEFLSSSLIKKYYKICEANQQLSAWFKDQAAQKRQEQQGRKIAEKLKKKNSKKSKKLQRTSEASHAGKISQTKGVGPGSSSASLHRCPTQPSRYEPLPGLRPLDIK